MAIFEDDFESYSVGPVPATNWTTSGFQVGIVNGGALPGTTKALQIILGGAEYNGTATYRTSATIFFAFKIDGGGRTLFAISNGPNSTGHTFTLFQLSVESDNTLTASVPVTGEFIQNSIDEIVKNDTWNFCQLNIQVSDILVSGQTFVHVKVDIAINGKLYISNDFTTTANVSQLKNGTAEINRFAFTSNSAWFDDFTLDTLQSIVSYPHLGTPELRVAHGVNELLQLVDNGKIEIPHGVLELTKLPDSASILIYQGVIELLINETTVAGLWKVREI